MSTQRLRRPSVSIYDYPEHLNPFNDDTNSQLQVHHDNTSKSSKESKHKFWTFGRSRKKRSNSFSIKSTWNGLFGKRKEVSEPVEKRSITTVSTTYKREPYDRPAVPSRFSKDQQEFDEALGTLTRRRKYTLDNNSSRYSSNLTVNGDPAKIYDGNPQDTTMSIMGVDLTPKPPVRRFGQVSPRSTDKIPPLDFEEKHPKQNGDLRDKSERTPVPPMRRFGNRSSQRLNGTTSDLEEDPANRSGVSLKDENENVPEDYVFKRFSQDAVRKSNLSINSCVSVTSTASTYGRKKRRAPQPPKRKEQLDSPLEGDSSQPEKKTVNSTPENSNQIELQITEPIDITKATENIDEMTKKSCEELNEKSPQKEEKDKLLSKVEDTSSDDIAKSTVKDETCDVLKDCAPEVNEKKDSSEERSAPNNSDETSEKVKLETQMEEKSNKEQSNIITEDPIEKDSVNIEYNRTSQEKLEIIKDIDQESDEVCLRKKDSSSTLSRCDSFSVKEEIEKIEKQIKALESKQQTSKEQEKLDDDQVTSTRLSIQENRRHFFENMVDDPSGPVKLEFKKLPCEQKDIHVVRLTDPPVPMAAPRDAVKVIELHISEPIRHRPELLDEVNPIPKPRRHSAQSLRDASESRLVKNGNKSPEDDGKRGSF
ncbi:muscle M-line assembly protein unc-89-like [Nylanderia fulva]|uniref:muscle M-line assembly protein unc-89-like n=1 Tax=Nylanderia fulva TaxID=613905 RepID=UPI0010FAE131|nr:muscle M-line assembly protein unc-89-like [Nylanderia fulva]XP_029156167.1 muscle M-line assembly protein unc-89-like [Nylanderia fulva]XP_029156168.1 muscle M-line assembly protein unc-89-like [Nylanderia fulva]XP_029156169.1 muscle M-line assembly protein unc-89-like [Nylanderia fulva]